MPPYFFKLPGQNLSLLDCSLQGNTLIDVSDKLFDAVLRKSCEVDWCSVPLGDDFGRSSGIKVAVVLKRSLQGKQDRQGRNGSVSARVDGKCDLPDSFCFLPAASVSGSCPSHIVTS